MGLKQRKRLLCRLTPALVSLCLLLPLLRPAVRQAFAPEEGVTLNILMYHSIVTSEANAGLYAVTLGQLEQDLAGLKARGYHFVSPRMVLDYTDEGAPLPEKPVLLTFDDGYRSSLTLLPALLERYGAYAVVAPVGSYCDAALQDDDGSPHSSMRWEDMAQAARELPRITLADHSYALHSTRPRLGCSRLPGESREHWQQIFLEDTEKMQRAMEDICGSAPYIYAYPYGSVPEGADALLRQQGFAMTFSCYERPCVLRQGDRDGLFSMGRFNRDGRLQSADFLDRWEEKQ